MAVWRLPLSITSITRWMRAATINHLKIKGNIVITLWIWYIQIIVVARAPDGRSLLGASPAARRSSASARSRN